MAPCARVFSGRYADEETIRTMLLKLIPMGGITILYKRGKFICTTPRELSRPEIDMIKLALRANHYEEDGEAE
ncbi:hypothetical protein QBC39DRAFT_140788 [Podospora conica]|nr:hypothetical protein QBC39DRAFT_140788 [Schizothecium conicum]